MMLVQLRGKVTCAMPAQGGFFSETQDSARVSDQLSALSVCPHGQQTHHQAHERLQTGGELAARWQRVTTPKYKEPPTSKTKEPGRKRGQD